MGGGGGGGGGQDNVRGKENVQDSVKSSWIPNFCHNVCPALQA